MNWKFWQRLRKPTAAAHEALIEELLRRMGRNKLLEAELIRASAEIAVQRRIKGQFRDMLVAESKRIKDLGELLPLIQGNVSNMRGGIATPEHVAKELTLIHARMYEICHASTAAIEALPKPDPESAVSYDNAILIKGGSGFPDTTA